MTERAPARLKVAVLGAGSIGCHLGGSLAPYADVTLIGRRAAMDALDEHGLTLTGGGRPSLRLDPGAVRTARSPAAAAGADYVLVTVKSPATRDAARELAAHLTPGTVVVSFQNGLHNPRIISSVLGPGHTVLAGMVPYNVVRATGAGPSDTPPAATPVGYHQGSGGALMIEDRPEAAALVRALGRAGLRVQVCRDMPAVQRAKLLMNLNNAVNALSGLPLREELGQRAFRTCLALCQAEALAAFRAEGVRPGRVGALPAPLMPRLLRLPDPLFRRLAASPLAIDAHARSSMWEDLRRGRPTEIDTLQGEIVAMAARHGLPAPVNARLVTLVRQAEAAAPERGRTWTGPELLADLRSQRA
ncbi:2-dehydropantoate 2-reductase [Streptomyces sp. XD-27]|uniref:2-dehydropantoate 2-reductase n=1 Tax=Streptomyces sp. XD-27 TaxID=3062779 RepID=UPI0026F45D85|nr:2-dehydropantoate 2-reductase [Streptomyces sp. XD-27]WKX71399.1 2-dehydropantoate 2-reductase [Streptomyces sp. XD-27]